MVYIKCEPGGVFTESPGDDGSITHTLHMVKSESTQLHNWRHEITRGQYVNNKNKLKLQLTGNCLNMCVVFFTLIFQIIWDSVMNKVKQVECDEEPFFLLSPFLLTCTGR